MNIRNLVLFQGLSNDANGRVIDSVRQAREAGVANITIKSPSEHPDLHLGSGHYNEPVMFEDGERVAKDHHEVISHLSGLVSPAQPQLQFAGAVS